MVLKYEELKVYGWQRLLLTTYNSKVLVLPRVLARNLQMVHSTIGRYETPSLHIARNVKWEASYGQGLGSDPNGAAINQIVLNHPLKA